MAHSDDAGLIIPPRLASLQAVIVPIFKKPEELTRIKEALDAHSATWAGQFTFHLDDRQGVNPGYKFADWELKGIPLRIELGPRDLEKGQVVVVRRDKARGEEGQKTFVRLEDLAEEVPRILEAIQKNLFQKALTFQQAHTYEVDSYEQFKIDLEQKAGFYVTWFDGDDADEARIKQETAATVRCIPFSLQGGRGRCFLTGRETDRRVIFAKSY
jgi:prolyl-tRNA synthetase